MAEQFVNPEETKLEDETVSDSTTQKHIQRIAEKAAQKASHTEQIYDQGSNDLFKVK
jgi:non-homologous end joining protein Ku